MKRNDKNQNQAQNLTNGIWQVINGKDGKTEITISHQKLLAYLNSLGFYRYDLENGEFVFIKVQSNIIEQVNKIQIQDAFFKYLDSLPEKDNSISNEQIKNKFLKGIDSYFSANFLARLGTLPNLEFVKDTKEKSFLFFRNCYVEVSANKVKCLEYENLQGNVWKRQIIPHDFNLQELNTKSDFYRFVYYVCKESHERVKELATLLGYLLHGYEFVKRKAICFTDSSLEQENNGRSGKTLLAKSLGKVRPYTEINGKDFNPLKPHKYQTCEIDTQILCLNDVRKDLSFESLYNDITEGVSVEKKNQKPFLIRPKIVITTNAPLRLNGSSDTDRVLEFEFSDFFSEARTPETIFGKRFFEEWNESEWNDFFNFIVFCLQSYLKHGLLTPKNENLSMRKLLNEVSEEVLEFIEAEIKFGETYEKQAIYSRFIEKYPNQKTKDRKRFFREIKAYCKHNKHLFNDRERGNRSQYFCIEPF